jgi:hypothetical protein
MEKLFCGCSVLFFTLGDSPCSVPGVSVQQEMSALAALFSGRLEWVRKGIERVLPETYFSLLVVCPRW